MFTRPYFSHVSKEGKAAKPFELPTADPDFHRQFLKSYNVPEFMQGPVTLKPQQLACKLKEDGVGVKVKTK